MKPQALPREELSEWETASFFNKWSYSVANEMLAKGEQGELQYEDLIRLADRDRAGVLLGELKRTFAVSKPFWFLPRLMVALIKATSWDCFLIGFYTLFEAGVMVVTPLLLRGLLLSLDSASSDRECFMWAGLLSGFGLLQVFLHHVLFFMSMRTGWNWKNASTALIHDRLVQLDSSALQNSGTGTGMLVNLVSNDVARFEEFAVFGMSAWVSMLVVAAILIELVFILNVASAFAGVACMVLLIPLMVYFAKRFAQYRGQTAAATDSRVRYISELIDGIITVKSFAWETPFFQMICSLREEESSYIAKSQLLRAVNQGLMFCTAAVVAFATFGVYWGTGGRLTIPQVFATISLLQVLRFSIGRAWTRSIETGSEAIASCLRIETFLALQPRVECAGAGAGAEAGAGAGAGALVSKSVPLFSLLPASFHYGTDSSNLVLQNISLSLSPGELVMVVGPVGAGKSSLLSAVLGELSSVGSQGPQGQQEVQGQGVQKRFLRAGTRVAYCAQRPWILASSVRSNVVLAGREEGDVGGLGETELDLEQRQGQSEQQRQQQQEMQQEMQQLRFDFKQARTLDLPLYTTAVESCLLVDDMSKWPAYDDTEVGERGISISGGQKARISLARAVYADADLYVLDDPLSAVDAHVGRALMSDCIMAALRNRGKAVLLVTHQLQYLQYADRVLVLDAQGRQTFYGTYAELQSDQGVMGSLDLAEEGTGAGVGAGAGAGVDVAPPRTPYRGVLDEGEGPVGARYDPDFRLKARERQAQEEREMELEKERGKGVRGGHGGQGQGEEAKGETSMEKQQRVIVQEEERARGQIALGVYWTYICSGGAARGMGAIGAIFLSQGVLMLSEYWLQWWAAESFGDQRDPKYIIIFAALVVACIIVGFYRALGWFNFTLRAASALHEKCLWAVVHTPMTFFVANPTGRVLNRFSKDQNQVDEMLPLTFFSFLETLVYCVAAVLLVCITIPWLALLMPFLGYIFLKLRQKYVATSREIKRYEAVTRSPIYADFSATLEGLPTLRAYKLEHRVGGLFRQQIDENSRPWFSFILAARWLGSRLDVETAVILGCVSFFAVWLRHSVDTGLLGFTLVYCSALSGLFQWMVRQSAEVENQMTAVERISAYAALPAEEGYKTDMPVRGGGGGGGGGGGEVEGVEMAVKGQGQGQVGQGRLQILDLTATYRSDLPPVLRHITLDIPAGAKVGICGRTGSGKSSTLLALLRLNIIQGEVLLDGKSLLQMDLQAARSAVAVIPQDPHLFSCSVRFNIDPFGLYTDPQLWEALQDAHIADAIRQDASGLGLSMLVEEGGKNFSVGERQLISLARAILRRCRVVLMDEVTASIDYLTDRLIQQTIRTSPALRDATIITVAHRLRTIADSDLIAVISAGEVVEKGPPALLLSGEGGAGGGGGGSGCGGDGGGGAVVGHFRTLVEESGEFEDIYRIATNKQAPPL